MTTRTNSSGILAALSAYVLWGLLPIYWKLLADVPAYEILCHRMVWSLLFTLGLIILMGRLRSFLSVLKDRKSIITFTVAAALLAVNWLLYIWAVNTGHVIEASLGYFINPLITVLFGVIFIKESMRPLQWGALFIALCGVLYLTFYYGQFPWIGLTLASSFALYGLLHKKTSLPALEGLSLETMVLFVPALLFLIFREGQGEAAFGHGTMGQTTLLVGTGLITSLPLLLFGFAAHKISLTLLGLLQYTAPTINLLLGILLWNEPFPLVRMVGFMMIWAALLIYILEGVMVRGRQKKRLKAG